VTIFSGTEGLSDIGGCLRSGAQGQVKRGVGAIAVELAIGLVAYKPDGGYQAVGADFGDGA
jgi:hypothetical protein